MTVDRYRAARQLATNYLRAKAKEIGAAPAASWDDLATTLDTTIASLDYLGCPKNAVDLVEQLRPKAASLSTELTTIQVEEHLKSATQLGILLEQEHGLIGALGCELLNDAVRTFEGITVNLTVAATPSTDRAERQHQLSTDALAAASGLDLVTRSVALRMAAGAGADLETVCKVALTLKDHLADRLIGHGVYAVVWRSQAAWEDLAYETLLGITNLAAHYSVRMAETELWSGVLARAPHERGWNTFCVLTAQLERRINEIAPTISKADDPEFAAFEVLRMCQLVTHAWAGAWLFDRATYSIDRLWFPIAESVNSERGVAPQIMRSALTAPVPAPTDLIEHLVGEEEPASALVLSLRYAKTIWPGVDVDTIHPIKLAVMAGTPPLLARGAWPVANQINLALTTGALEGDHQTYEAANLTSRLLLNDHTVRAYSSSSGWEERMIRGWTD